MSEDEPIENVLRRFQRHGLAGAMTTPSKGATSSSSQPRQQPQTRSQSQVNDESGSEQEEEVHSTTDYMIPRVEGAPEVRIPKNARYTVPIPPIDSRVKENGDLVGYAAVVKFVDYNLGDGKTYPHFKPDQYLKIEKNPWTGRNECVPLPHVQILELSGLLNLLRLPHFGWGAEVNAMVHILLSCVHGGYL